MFKLKTFTFKFKFVNKWAPLALENIQIKLNAYSDIFEYFMSINVVVFIAHIFFASLFITNKNVFLSLYCPIIRDINIIMFKC